MPGDSLLAAQTFDSVRIADSLNQIHSETAAYSSASNDFLTDIIPVILILAGVFFYQLRKKMVREKAYKMQASNFIQYDEWLAAYNEYYKSLPVNLRHRFLDRVAWFITSKTFVYADLAPEEKMPLLISAASVQISFGLDKYLLDFFDTIYIMQHSYRYGLYNKPFEGHVSSSGIYLSWEDFLKGYENYTNADNVGIHEMAHALAYVNFMAGANNGQDEDFIKRFYDFSAVARPIFGDMQHGKVTMLNEYAATNYNEFWAVAVETFFEQSLQMKVDMPGLYTALCNLLNQDPLLPEKLLLIPAAL